MVPHQWMVRVHCMQQNDYKNTYSKIKRPTELDNFDFDFDFE